MSRTVVQPDTLKDPRPRYSQGILTEGGRLLFIAGQTAVDRDGSVVGKGDPETQAEQVFANLGAVLAAAGGTFDNLVSTTTYLTDIKYRDALNKVRLKYYVRSQPANTLIVVKALAAEDLLIEIDGIAVI
jgi:enamine deaminase RidA (YjgF/YER057c/UK114 family)